MLFHNLINYLRLYCLLFSGEKLREGGLEMRTPSKVKKKIKKLTNFRRSVLVIFKK